MLYRPAVLGRGPAPALDRWLALAAGTAALQLVPFPPLLRTAVSPAAERVGTALSLTPARGSLPLTIDADATAAAVLLFGGALVLFVCARHIFAAGGLRLVVRVLACSGLTLSIVAVAQDATARGLMYWTWRPLDQGPAPFGPFVNRNHFGTWAILVAPLCAGYVMAHATAHHGPRAGTPWQRRLLDALDLRGGLLLGAAVLLMAATVVSLSRSAVIGMVAAAAVAALLARGRLVAAPRRLARPAILIAGGTMASVAIVLWGMDASLVTGRLASAGASVAGRAAIWRDTMAVVRDFWLTGTGLGTYQTSMAVYQRDLAGVIFNQAHNHYLQVLSEGGLLVAIPLAGALAALLRGASRRLASDDTPIFWIRAGAASGLFGVAVQSLLETGLTTPANAATAAVAAAILVHASSREAAAPTP